MLRATSLEDFDAIICLDFEFGAAPGERPMPRCVVARELRSGRAWRVWLDGMRVPCPYPVGPRILFIAYYASAEMGCHLVLGWPMPENVIDLYVEFKNQKNVFSASVQPERGGLLYALRSFGLNAIADEEKTTMRDLALRGGTYSGDEIAALLEYCAGDVDGLRRLFSAMAPTLDLQRALLRGAAMLSAARIEHQGIPIDVGALATMREHWSDIRLDLIRRIDAGYGVYDEAGHFKTGRFLEYLERCGLAAVWPRTASGVISLDGNTLKDMARMHPEIHPLRELREGLSAMRLGDLAVGADDRNRTLLSPFGARTSRNTPSTTKGVFGSAVFMRSLIQPSPGRTLVYIDFAQQEFAIAAALSGDVNMIEAYLSGDPYLAFARQCGQAPPSATKKSHSKVRDLFKECVLAVQYSMGAASLAHRIGQPIEQGRQLLALHRETYPTFWRWSDAVIDTAMWTGELTTVFGWRARTYEDARSTSLRNFPMQGNGAEMLRLACALAHDAGVAICMPVHDALLIEAADADAEEAIAKTVGAMGAASEIVLGGFRVRAEVEYVVRYPGRYADPRGAKMWKLIWDAIAEAQREH